MQESREIETSNAGARKRFYAPALIIIGVILILTVILTITLFQTTDRRRLMTYSILEDEALMVMKVLELTVDTADLSPGNVERLLVPYFETLVAADEIAYLAVINEEGRYSLHTNPDLQGKISQSGYNIHKVLFEGEKFFNPNKVIKSERIFEIIKKMDFKKYLEVNHRPPPVAERRALLLGLRIKEIETAESDDFYYTLLVTIILLVVGTAALYFLIVTQNYYLVNLNLDQMELYTENLVKSMYNALISFDREAHIVTLNKAAEELFGMSEKEIRGKTLDVMLPGEENKHIIQLVYENIRIVEHETVFINPEGKEIPISLNLSEVTNEAGESLGQVLVIQDLSEIKSLKDAVQRTERMASLGRMASAVAHEIRNPLNAIKGFAQFLKQRAPQDNEEAKFISIILKEIDRLNLVVSELSSFAKPITPKYKILDLNEIIDESLLLLKSDAELQNIKVEKSYDTTLPAFEIDEGRIKQILLNICQNAFEAMPKGGTLSIRTQFDAEHLRAVIAIEDTGVGIAKENLPKLFDPYFTTKKEGSGLGLSIVHKIVENLDGKIVCDSELNSGTIFTVTIPVQQENRHRRLNSKKVKSKKRNA